MGPFCVNLSTYLPRVVTSVVKFAISVSTVTIRAQAQQSTKALTHLIWAKIDEINTVQLYLHE